MENGEISDGYHTFNEIYYHRLVLARALFNLARNDCLKSKKHDDGTMFNGYFIVGLNTKQGWATYHYPLEEWDSFLCKEVEYFPKWDGHTSNDAINRIDNYFQSRLCSIGI